MPGLDRTGPMGDGPMTGWGAGDCTGQGPRVSRRRYSRGFGRAADFGRGMFYGMRRRARGGFFAPGRGRGFVSGGFGYGRRQFIDDYREDEVPETEKKYEVEMLKEEAEYLQKELEAVKNRIDEVESSHKKED